MAFTVPNFTSQFAVMRHGTSHYIKKTAYLSNRENGDNLSVERNDIKNTEFINIL
jgi:hypothetical protein